MFHHPSGKTAGGDSLKGGLKETFSIQRVGIALFPCVIFLPDRRKFPLPPLLPSATLQPLPCREQKGETHPSQKEPALIRRDWVCWGFVCAGVGGVHSHSGLPQGFLCGRPASLHHLGHPNQRHGTKRKVYPYQCVFYPDSPINQQSFFENLLSPLYCAPNAWKGELSPFF